MIKRDLNVEIKDRNENTQLSNKKQVALTASKTQRQFVENAAIVLSRIFSSEQKIMRQNALNNRMLHGEVRYLSELTDIQIENLINLSTNRSSLSYSNIKYTTNVRAINKIVTNNIYSNS